MPKHKQHIYDGFPPELVEGASFDGELEIPVIKGTWDLTPPHFLCPFSRRDATRMRDEYICFYEFDWKFKPVIVNAASYP